MMMMLAYVDIDHQHKCYENLYECYSRAELNGLRPSALGVACFFKLQERFDVCVISPLD